MQPDPQMRRISETDDLYSLCIYHYKNFLGSKQFKGTDRPILALNENKSKKTVPSIEEPNKESDPLLPESEEPSIEGKSRQASITQYERNPKNRKKALERDNYQCRVCQMNFEAVYGEIGRNYIEVHHLYPASNMEKEQEVFKFDALDIERGLVCLCANCHAMIHRGGHFEERDGKRIMIPMSLKELQKKYNDLNHKF
jgi:predicted HNH restriction endonuclease